MRIPKHCLYRAGWAAALALGGLLGGLSVSWAQGPAGTAQQAWRPGSATGQPADYAGSQRCSGCHTAKANTEMANALARPAEAAILRQHPTLSSVAGPYTYTVQSTDKQVQFTVSDSQGKITEPVFLVVGAGLIYQSYLIQHEGAYYRLPVAYFAREEKLLYTGDAATPPVSLEAALGTPLPTGPVPSCVKCHGTPNGGEAAADSDTLSHGISCEACHGPGAKHVAAMRAGNMQDMHIFDPGPLKPGEAMEFCGECHHLQDVKSGAWKGIRTVLSPPARLMESRCFNATDRRSRCTLCHEPHAPLVVEMARYDEQCLSCHASGKGGPATAAQTGKACPVGSEKCASCHMPKVEVPGSHFSFTDHRIRIVRAGEPFPE